MDQARTVAATYSGEYAEFVKDNAIFYTALLQVLVSQMQYVDVNYDPARCDTEALNAFHMHVVHPSFHKGFVSTMRYCCTHFLSVP